MALPVSTHWRLVVGFLLGTLLIAGIEQGVVFSTAFQLQPNRLAFAITFDLLVGIPLLYYLLVVRPLSVSPLSLVAVCLAAVGLANLILPPDHRQYVHGAERLLIIAELGVMAIAVRNLRKIRAEYVRLDALQPDFVANLEQALSQTLGNVPGLNWLTGEVAVLHYTFFGLWIKPELKSGQLSYTLYRESGVTALGITLLVVGGVETLVIHLLVMRWHQTVAWVLLGLSLYSMLIVIGYLVSLRKRPTLLADGWLRVRVGFFYRADIPLATIHHIERVRLTNEDMTFDDLAKVVGSTPNVLIHLREPVTLTGIYQRSRPTQAIGLFVDEPDGLLNAANTRYGVSLQSDQ